VEGLGAKGRMAGKYQSDLKVCAGARGWKGKRGESAGAKSGGEIGEGQAEQMRQAMRRREKGYLCQTQGSLLGRFPNLPLGEFGLLLTLHGDSD
jgi:hypothetical protein